MQRSSKNIQVWTFAPDELDDADLAYCRSLLSRDEVDRADRFHFDRDRRAFTAAHAIVRVALSREAPAVMPRHWSFKSGQHGRPEIAGDSWGLRFNLSHTRGLVGCVIARAVDCGIDIEEAERDLSVESLEGVVLAELERKSMESLEPAKRKDRLLRYWTLKEAYAKGRGLGLSLPLTQVAFQIDGGTPRLAHDRQSPEDPTLWRFRQWRPTPRHWLAVALRTAGSEPEIEMVEPTEFVARRAGPNVSVEADVPQS